MGWACRRAWGRINQIWGGGPVFPQQRRARRDIAVERRKCVEKPMALVRPGQNPHKIKKKVVFKSLTWIKIPPNREKCEEFVKMVGETDRQGDFEPTRGFRVSSREEVARHFLMRDPTGQLFSTLHYMGTVEDWVFH